MSQQADSGRGNILVSLRGSEASLVVQALMELGAGDTSMVGEADRLYGQVVADSELRGARHRAMNFLFEGRETAWGRLALWPWPTGLSDEEVASLVRQRGEALIQVRMDANCVAVIKIALRFALAHFGDCWEEWIIRAGPTEREYYETPEAARALLKKVEGMSIR